MTTNHALFFIMNGPRAGREAKSMEVAEAVKAYWTKRKEAGDIDHFENVMLASSGNQDMPAGFTLVTGDREKLQKIRWDDEEFLDLHTMTMATMNGYACLDGYAGEGYTNHIARLVRLMKQ